MELRHLLTFKTIVEKGGFKKAADELGYAQSSVTNHIKDLVNCDIILHGTVHQA